LSSHEDVLGIGRIAHSVLISVLDRGEWTVSRPGRFTSIEEDHNTHYRGGWVGIRADPDAVKKRNIFFLYQE
jgi:hypothetical protein